MGALITIEDEQGDEQLVFLSPVAGGLKIHFDDKEMTLITPSSPMGKALSGSITGDEINVNIKNETKYYEILLIS